MCYAKPGTRCLSHVVEDINKSKSDLKETQAKVDNLESADSISSNQKKSLDSAKAKIGKLKSKIESLEKEKNYTKQGLKELYAKEVRVRKYGTAEERDNIIEQVNDANEVYRSRADAYDKIHGTVDYRKPASGFSEKDFEKASQKADAFRTKMYNLREVKDSAKTSSDRDKAILQMRSLKKEIENFNESNEHMLKTRDHVENGYIDNPTPISKLEDDKSKYMTDAKNAFEEYQSNGSRNARDFAVYSKNMALANGKMVGLAKVNYRMEMPCLKSSSGSTMNYGMTYSEDGKTAYWENYKTGEKVEYNDGVANKGKAFMIRGEKYTIDREIQPVTVHKDNWTAEPRIVSNISRMRVLSELKNTND